MLSMFVLVLPLVSSFPLQLFEGNLCRLPSGLTGVCRPVESCPSAVTAFRERHVLPVRCGFEGGVEVVCCKSEVKMSEMKTSRAEQACRTYASESPQRVNTLILNGEEATRGEFPHMAVLGFNPNGGRGLQWNCGGTLISDQWVLTAAHCVTDQRWILRRVRLGALDLNATDDLAEEFNVANVTVHPEYKNRYNDIALVKLSRKIRTFTEDILPACLYTKQDVPAEKLTISGWGGSGKNGREYTGLLMKAFISSMPLDQCNTTYANSRTSRFLLSGVNENMICARDPAGVMDTCPGDSGGPLQQLHDELNSGVYDVLGVTSVGVGTCGGSTPTIYTRVSSYVPWIESIVWRDS